MDILGGCEKEWTNDRARTGARGGECRYLNTQIFSFFISIVGGLSSPYTKEYKVMRTKIKEERDAN